MSLKVSVALFLLLTWGYHDTSAEDSPEIESVEEIEHYDLEQNISPLESDSHEEDIETFHSLCEDDEELYHNETMKCYRKLSQRGQSPCGPLEYFIRESGGYGVCVEQMCEDPFEELYHNETKKCYEEHSQGPCGEYQLFYEFWEEYGACGCIRDDKPDGCSHLHRPVLNWPGSKRCYLAYDQGPCKTGEWIVMNRTTFLSECRPNPCHGLKLQKRLKGIEMSPGSSAEIFWFSRGNACYQTFTQAYCQPNEYVRFLGTIPIPTCLGVKDELKCDFAIASSVSGDCAQGLKRVGDHCVPYGDGAYE